MDLDAIGAFLERSWAALLGSTGAFWIEVKTVAGQYFLGENGLRIFFAFGIVILFVIVRRLLAHFIVARLRRLAQGTKMQIDDLVLDAVEQPLTFVPVAFGVFLAANILQLDGPAASASGRIVQSLIAFTIFWATYRIISPLGYLLSPLGRLYSETLVSWVIKGLKGFAVFLGVFSILTIWGIPVMPILASFSLLSVAVALGAQDLFKNLIAGALIIGERRFRTGHWIKVEGVVEGTVEAVNFRSTRVRRFDKAPVWVPNSKLSDDVVINFSEMSHRRIYWLIGLEYRATKDQLRAIRNRIEAYLTEHEAFAQPPEVPLFVRIDRFSDSSIDMLLYCFTRTTVWGEWLEIKEELAIAIKDIVESEGAGFAFPSQSLYIETAPGSGPDLYTPPEGTKADV